jgi:hypothetical protein
MQIEWVEEKFPDVAEAFGNARNSRTRPTAAPAKRVAMRRDYHGDLVKVPSCSG